MHHLRFWSSLDKLFQTVLPLMRDEWTPSTVITRPWRWCKHNLSPRVSISWTSIFLCKVLLICCLYGWKCDDSFLPLYVHETAWGNFCCKLELKIAQLESCGTRLCLQKTEACEWKLTRKPEELSRRQRKRHTKFLSRKDEFSGGSCSGL